MELILKPSPIHGVGVFAVKPIKRGTVLPLFDPRDWRVVKKPTGIDKRFCSNGNGKYYAPRNWHRMSIGWYLNESRLPNVDAKDWQALRDIRAGEELTIDYKNLR